MVGRWFWSLKLVSLLGVHFFSQFASTWTCGKRSLSQRTPAPQGSWNWESQRWGLGRGQPGSLGLGLRLQRPHQPWGWTQLHCGSQVWSGMGQHP